MKETIAYPIYLLEELILILKELEEIREFLSEIEFFMDKNKISRKKKAAAFNLCAEYFGMSLKFDKYSSQLVYTIFNFV